MMFSKVIEKSSKRAAWVIGITAVTLLGGIAHAAQKAVADRRLTMTEAQALVPTDKEGSEFPLEVNELVLKQLNRYLATPDGRRFIRESLERMKEFEKTIDSHLDEAQLPEELKAIPLVESGYRNFPQDDNAAHGAGIWMFIRSTARRFGLKVNENIDERLDVVKETAAAARILKHHYKKFSDWRLALLAYNMGEGAVAKAIRETGSRDAWGIIDAGYQNDPNYLQSVIATALILKNPELLR